MSDYLFIHLEHIYRFHNLIDNYNADVHGLVSFDPEHSMFLCRGGLDLMLVFSQTCAGWEICEREGCAVMGVVTVDFNHGQSRWLLPLTLTLNTVRSVLTHWCLKTAEAHQHCEVGT